MSTRTLFALGLALLGLALVGRVVVAARSGPRQTQVERITGQTGSRPGGGTGTNSGTTGSDGDPAPPVLAVIEAEWPTRMEVNQSDSIRVTLSRVAPGYRAVPQVAGNQTALATPLPVGTPGVALERAFGPAYDASAQANLAAIAFDLRPLDEAEQALEPSVVTWEWNVIPRNAGDQVVNVSVEGHWKPKGGGAAVQRQLWRARLSTEVAQPLVATGQISLLSIVAGFAGSGLSVPWLYERYKERRPRPLREPPEDEGDEAEPPPEKPA